MYKLQASDKSDWEYQEEKKRLRKEEKNKRNQRKGKTNRWQENE
jgi:hypothetical protein